MVLLILLANCSQGGLEGFALQETLFVVWFASETGNQHTKKQVFREPDGPRSPR